MIEVVLGSAFGLVLGTGTLMLVGKLYGDLKEKSRQRQYEKSLEKRKMGYTCDPWDRDWKK